MRDAALHGNSDLSWNLRGKGHGRGGSRSNRTARHAGLRGRLQQKTTGTCQQLRSRGAVYVNSTQVQSAERHTNETGVTWLTCQHSFSAELLVLYSIEDKMYKHAKHFTQTHRKYKAELGLELYCSHYMPCLLHNSASHICTEGLRTLSN